MKTLIEVVSNITGEVVDVVDCHDKPPRQIEKILNGMARQMSDEFYARVVRIDEVTE